MAQACRFSSAKAAERWFDSVIAPGECEAGAFGAPGYGVQPLKHTDFE
jgi:hypothetical protein